MHINVYKCCQCGKKLFINTGIRKYLNRDDSLEIKKALSKGCCHQLKISDKGLELLICTINNNVYKFAMKNQYGEIID